MNTLATAFDHAIPYTVSIPSFGEDWGFVLAFNGSKSQAQQLVDISPEVIDTMIEERIELVKGVKEHPFRSVGVKYAVTGNERGGEALKLYDGEAHRGLFSLSKPLRLAIRSDKRIMTEENPIFMY